VSRAVVAMNRVLPPELLQVVIGAGPTGAALVDHVDMVCVTGSPETGRRVMERASRRLTPVLLELGGKDPMIVLADADLDRAARAAAWGGCMMSGQVCMSVERVYVEEAVAETFTKKLVAQMQALRVGPNGPDADIDYGAFTSPRQMAIVEEHLADAVAKGARVLCGGRRCGPETGDFLEATVDEIMTRSPKTIRPDQLVSETIELINAMKITALFVIEGLNKCASEVLLPRQSPESFTRSLLNLGWIRTEE